MSPSANLAITGVVNLLELIGLEVLALFCWPRRRAAGVFLVTVSHHPNHLLLTVR